jgi:glycosyltransferase involved in cell wall biosynthesis
MTSSSDRTNQNLIKPNMSSELRVLIIEISLLGHHSVYLSHTIKAFANTARQITVALPYGLDVQAVVNTSVMRQTNIDVLHFKPSFDLTSTSTNGLAARELAVWKAFKKIHLEASSMNSIDLVVLPYMDYCLHAIGLLGSPFGKTKYAGICMRPNFHHKYFRLTQSIAALSWIKEILFKRALSNKHLVKIFAADELLPKFVQETSPSLSTKLEHMPDPVDEAGTVDRLKVRSAFATPPKAKVILVYGAIDERKGVVQLLDALEHSPELNNWHVWLIGMLSSPLSNMLAEQHWTTVQNSSRIFVLNSFVDADTEKEALGGCDVVWVAYRNHFGMSGVMVHAGMYKKPIIACENGLIGWYAQSEKIGEITNGEVSSTIAAIDKLDDPAFASKLGEAGYEKFKNNTWGKFEDKLRSLLEI